MNESKPCIICQENPALAATQYICSVCYEAAQSKLLERRTLKSSWINDALRVFNVPKTALTLTGQKTKSYTAALANISMSHIPFITIQGPYMSGKTSLGVAKMHLLYIKGIRSMYYCNLIDYSDFMESALMKDVLTNSRVVFFDNFGAEGVNTSYLAGILNSRAKDTSQHTLFAIHGEKTMSKKIYFDSNIDQYLHIFAKRFPVITLS